MLKAWSAQQLAERWLHEFYTRLSNDPSSLHILYLDNAEAIYTGHVLSGSSSDEGYLMSGRSEIAGFFGCPAISAKFCGSKVKVDVVHPLPNPMCLNAISLSVKGTLFLPVNSVLYESAEYTHFISLSPAAQRFSNGPVSYLIATEFLHIYRKPLAASPFSSADQPAAATPSTASINAGPAGTPSAGQEPPLLSHPPHMITALPAAAALPAPGMIEGAQKMMATENLPPPPPPPMRPRYNDELSLHAAEVIPPGPGAALSEIKGMSLQQIVDAVNDALLVLWPGTEGRCVHVMRPINSLVNNPNVHNARTFFFLHFNKIELVDKLRKAGQLTICDGVLIKLSPVRRKYPNYNNANRGSGLSRNMSNKQASIPLSLETTPAIDSSATGLATSLENGKSANVAGDAGGGRKKSQNKSKRSSNKI